MLRRLLSAAGAAALLLAFTAGGTVLPAAAEENEYVLLIDDFEDEATIANYSSYTAQPGSLYQSKTHAHSGENSAMFVSQGAFGCVVNQPDFNNQIRLTADGEVLELVKAADKLSAYIKCVEELKAGNAEFRRAAEQTRAALDAMGLPELDYFMEHCAESFSMTLDELE